MKKLLLEGRLTLEGPGGGAVVNADGETVRIDFPTIRSAVSAWRLTKRLNVDGTFNAAGIAVDVTVRGVRVRRFGPRD